MKIEGRTFIVSGGSSGLGLATASLLLTLGAKVSILDLNAPPTSASPAALTDPSRTLFTSTDVSTTTSITSAVSSTLAWIKSTSAPLAGIICCAGIGSAERALPRQPQDASTKNFRMMDMKLFDRILAINLRGTVDLIRQSLPHLALNHPEGADGERGVVIVVSSVAAYEGQVGQWAYSASKGAVASMVLPGIFETGMTNPRPQAKPQTLAGMSEDKGQGQKAGGGKVGDRSGVNPNMIEYPRRMGKGDEFARLVKEIVENPMLNGGVIRLDGGVRMPSRL